MSVDSLSALLSDSIKALGLAPAVPEKDGGYMLEVDGTVEVEIKPDADTESVVFLPKVGEYGEDEKLKVWGELLEANYLWLGTGGCTLSVNQAAASVHLAARVPAQGLDGDRLLPHLQAFVDTAEFWRGRLSGRDAAAPDASGKAENPSAIGGGPVYA